MRTFEYVILSLCVGALCLLAAQTLGGMIAHSLNQSAALIAKG